LAYASVIFVDPEFKSIKLNLILLPQLLVVHIPARLWLSSHPHKTLVFNKVVSESVYGLVGSLMIIL